MKQTFTLLFLLFATIAFAQNSQENMDWQWATRFGGYCFQNPGVGLKLLNYPHNLEIDAEGNAYIFGTYGDNASFYDFSNGLAFDSPIYGDHCSGTFVAKFDCNGNVVWHKALVRETNIDHEAQYMILKDNRLYLQGTAHIPVSGFGNYVYFLDTTINGWTLNQLPEQQVFPWISNNYYTYMMVFDLDGNMLDYDLFSLYKEDMYSYNGEWTGKRTYYLFDQYGDIGKPVPFAIDNQHNYYMLAKMRCDGLQDSLLNTIIPQKMVFKHNGVDITDTIMPEDNKYVYRMLKFDQDFNLLYNKSIIESINAPYEYLHMQFNDMKCDSENNVYLCGFVYVRDTASVSHYPYDLELGNDKHIYVYTPGSEGIIIKMNSDGEILWVNQTRNHGDNNTESNFKSMLLDEISGNIYISDYSMPKQSFFPDDYTIFGDNDTLVNNCDGIFISFTDVIVCYDTAGNYKWYNCPTTTYCEIGSIAKHNDKLYAGVCWSGTGLVCGDSTFLPTEQYQYRLGVSICEWDLEGNMTDVKQIYSMAQSSNNIEPYDTRINSLGEIYTVGRFDNRMAFGEDTIIAKSESDMFIAKFGLPCQTYIYDTATYCYGDVVQGVTLTTSGDYTFTYPEGSQEFDSIVLVHATVLPPLTIGLNDTTVCTAQQFYLDACGEFDSYQWSTGGTGCTEMLQFDNACTQSVTLTVTRGECSASKTISITAQVCDGITEPTATAMSLYPNPASDIVTIFGDGFISATVIDINGRTLLRTTAMQLDISGLRPGEYVVKIERLNGETEELKMVKE